MTNPANCSTLISQQDTALIIIDIQEKLMPVISDAELVIKNALKLVQFARIINLPVLVTENELFGLEPVLKQDFDACCNPDFTRRLTELGKKALIFTGAESHVCVMQTVLHLLPRYDIHVVSDAVGSRAWENRQIALERMRQAGAVISSTEMVIFELLRKSGTDEFRAALRLIR